MAGFGLSYTSWTYTVTQQPSALQLLPLQTLLAETAAQGHQFPQIAKQRAAESASAWRSTAGFRINVTNTGDRDADDVVLGFLEPPGAGVDGTPLQQLFDFQRVHVRAHESVTVELTPAITDFALAQLNGTLRAAAGEYKAHFGVKEAKTLGMGFVEVDFRAI